MLTAKISSIKGLVTFGGESEEILKNKDLISEHGGILTIDEFAKIIFKDGREIEIAGPISFDVNSSFFHENTFENSIIHISSTARIKYINNITNDRQETENTNDNQSINNQQNKDTQSTKDTNSNQQSEDAQTTENTDVPSSTILGSGEISGTDESENILGSSLNDTIKAGAGNDIISSGDGYDRIYAGDGDDIIYGGASTDRIHGGNGNDTIYGNASKDFIYGGLGNDTIYGGEGNDYLEGNAGNDTINGNEGNDTIRGGNGDDIINGGTGYNRLYGGAGNDTIYVTEGDNTSEKIRGGTGNDTVIFSGNRADYTIQYQEPYGRTTIENIQTGEKQYIYDVERIQFSDMTLSINEKVIDNDTLIVSVNNQITSITEEDSSLTTSTVIGKAVSTNPNNSIITFSIDDTTNYVINTNSGEITLSQAGLDLINTGQDLPNYKVTANSSTGDSGSITINPVNTIDVNDDISQVIDSDNNANEILENVEDGTYTGVTLNAVDEDGETVTYSIEDTSLPFRVESDGRILVNGYNQIDYETTQSYTFTVKATSADGSSTTQDITINVKDIAETVASNGSINTFDNFQSAVLVDGIVEGIEYTTSSGITGITDKNGRFNFMEGDNVSFSVGGVVLGVATAQDVAKGQIFLQDIADVKLIDVNDEYVENMATFLQSIDSDDSDNIVITQEIRDSLANIDMDIETVSEEDIQNLIESMGHEYVEEDVAMQHVQDMIEEYASIDESKFDERVEDIDFDNIELDFDNLSKLTNSEDNSFYSSESVDKLDLSDVLQDEELATLLGENEENPNIGNIPLNEENENGEDINDIYDPFKVLEESSSHLIANANYYLDVFGNEPNEH